MWIVTDQGFFSFVVDRRDPNYLWLRARVREDLARNFPDAEIIEKPGADYLFRAKVLRKDVADRMAQMIMEADITGHFKDVALKRSAKPTHGNRMSAMYAFWRGMAELQPYAPYSKVPRPKVQPWTPPKRDTRSGVGQTGLPMFSNPGGTGTYPRDYDWSTNPWSSDFVGHAQADPPIGGSEQVHPDVLDEVTEMLLAAATEDEFEERWATLTDAEREAYLDDQEAEQRAREEIGEELGGAARAAELRPDGEGWVDVSPDTYPAPRQTRRERRQRRREQEKPDLSTQEGRNRQAYLDKQAKRGKGRKNRHNQQG